MLLGAVSLTAAFVATAFGAALPLVDPPKSLEKRDYVESYEVWEINDNSTEEYSRETDDAWSKVELKFPMTIFDKSSSTVWFSMNGLISLDEPSANPSIPTKQLPIDPASCGLGSSCLPKNTLALMWQDLFMPIGVEGLAVEWIYHEPSLRPDIGHHYHIIFNVCDKKAVLSDGIPKETKKCGKATRFFGLNYYENKPGVFHISWHFDKEVTNPGVIGAQAYPKYIQVPYPGNIDLPDNPDYYVSCIILDTVKGTTIVPKDRKDC
ncbi:hypothetical protein Dda_7404 [Drechslerella dactyloides]|uniref:Uncharacterized protein n=1 Tax=Drechslerella dactyloides TaxID=74499 RepID=A0AAD6NGR8_DREDA|nr:hypothetical protein Dda_7404 [Drechslerella dactyloides]